VAFTNPHIFGYSAEREICIGAKGISGSIGRVISLKKIYSIEQNYDIFHFHGCTVFPRGLDILLWKLKSKKIFLHYHGSEIRNHPDRYFLSMARFADKIFVSTPDLLIFVPGSVWIPNPVNLNICDYAQTEESGGRLRVFHAPSNMGSKGTLIIRKAINSLKEKGYPIDWICLSGQKHNAILRSMSESDVVIDQVNSLFGTYGLVSCEAMAMSKPVICSINQEFEDIYKDCPILKIQNDDPREIENHLISLIEDNEFRKNVGRAGLRYVKNVHNPKKIVDQLYSD